MHRRTVVLAMLMVHGCTSRAHVEPPDLSGYQALLHAPPGARALTRVALPDPALRIELEAELVEGAYGELLLYREPARALDLPLDGDRVTLGEDGEPLPAPDAAWALGEALDWRSADPQRWAARRVAPSGCVAPAATSVDLGRGKPLFMERWGADEVVVGLFEADRVLRLHVVSPRGSRRAEVDLTSMSGDDYLRGAVDPRGHLWIARTASIATRSVSALHLVELDAALRPIAEHVVPTGLPHEDALVANVVVGIADGRAEVFALYAPFERASPPRVLRWREGEAAAFVLPWPGEQAVSACRAVGIYRSHLEWVGPDEITFLFRQGVVQRWRRGALEGELADGGICGATVLEDRVVPGALLVLQPERETELPAEPTRVMRLGAGGDWVRLGEAPLANALDLVRWQGRELATGDGGQLYELQPRSSGVDVCPAIRTEPPNNRMDRLVVVGDRLAATGAAQEGDGVLVYWLEVR